jgi:CRISPR-associated endonuclease/helicase Cas3
MTVPPSPGGRRNSLGSSVQERMDSFYRYWGKARADTQDGPQYHLLPYHCLDVAATGRVLLRQQPLLHRQLSELTGIPHDPLLDWITLLLALHDLGKFSDSFQNQRPDLFQKLQKRSTSAPYERHDLLGFECFRTLVLRVFREVMPDAGRSSMSDEDLKDVLEPWLSAVTGHHGQPSRLDIRPFLLGLHFPEHVQNDILLFVRDLLNLLLPGGLPFNHEIDDQYLKTFSRVSWIMAGLAVAADWIGSNQRWFPYCDKQMSLNDYWSKISMPRAEIAIAESGLLAVRTAPESDIKILFSKIAVPTPLQRLSEIIEIGNSPQLYIMEEITGGGKTEAALTLAHRIMAKGFADGIYMGLPTMATANAMHNRVREMYRKLYVADGDPSLILAHSFSKMVLEMERKDQIDHGYGQGERSASQDCAAWLMDSRKKALLAHVGIGTIDQALLSILPVRHQSLRMFGLLRKVLIVDEVHACDAYVHRLLCTLLEFHAAQGGSAILLSATLPQAMRQQLLEAFAKGSRQGIQTFQSNAYPLLTCLDKGEVKEYPVEARQDVSRSIKVQPLHSTDEVKMALQAALDGGGCACWIRNTVADALQAYHEWVERLGESQVMLFHARFALGDRLAIEDEVNRRFGLNSKKKSRKGKLLIATQVVEQSLDLDFDFMVTDLAPIDLIIQRSGRLQRHDRGRRIPPVLGVFMPEPIQNAGRDWFKGFFPRAVKVYDHHGQLWLTAKWLTEHEAFVMPRDARIMIESVYAETSQELIPKDLLAMENRSHGEDRADMSLGDLNSLKLDEGYRSTMNQWQDDAYAPTRLGEPTVTVRLARWDGTQLAPWFDQNTGHDWELSQLSIRKWWITGEDPNNLPETVAAAKKTMPDEGRYCIIIPMLSIDGEWRGQAINGRGVTVKITYDSRIGLKIVGGGIHESD